VFDNLYYVGEKEYSAWAVTTSAGIILIDAIFDYSVEDEVVGGLKKLGLDPAQIKYVIVSHAHADHAAGAKLLQERFGARVVMGAADYDLLDKQNPSWKPKRDITATDGYQLTLGDTTLTLTLTPGHTLGTISTLVPVRDGGRTHLAAAWGGTAFNFGPDKDRLRMYIDSSVKFRDIVQKAGADVLIANHTAFDGSKTKLPALATRQPGAPHPYVIGPDAVRRYLVVANECAQAALAALS
jgi:metallo-beta-lactamase class B